MLSRGEHLLATCSVHSTHQKIHSTHNKSTRNDKNNIIWLFRKLLRHQIMGSSDRMSIRVYVNVAKISALFASSLGMLWQRKGESGEHKLREWLTTFQNRVAFYLPGGKSREYLRDLREEKVHIKGESETRGTCA